VLSTGTAWATAAPEAFSYLMGSVGMREPYGAIISSSGEVGESSAL